MLLVDDCGILRRNPQRVAEFSMLDLLAEICHTVLESNKKIWLLNMQFKKLIKNFQKLPFFSFKEAMALSSDSPAQFKNQLSVWATAGKIERLRRGYYILSETYRKYEPSVYYISNYLYRPSYISLFTALQFYGLIPDAVAGIQAVTPLHGKEWPSSLGFFQYRFVKQDKFWGYREIAGSVSGTPQNNFLLAEPEKALLDFFYLQEGQWPLERIKQMRFQSAETLNMAKLNEFAARFNSPKVTRAVKNLVRYFKDENL